MATYFKDKNALLSIFNLFVMSSMYGFLGDVVHDVLGRNRLPSPRLTADDGTLQEKELNFKLQSTSCSPDQESGALTNELSSRTQEAS
jgi:hypothetical protein